MTVKDDEKQLFKTLKKYGYYEQGYGDHVSPEEYRKNKRFVDEVARELGIPDKRSYSILMKWSGRGLWNYGVSARTGWFEDTGEYPDHHFVERWKNSGWYQELLSSL